MKSALFSFRIKNAFKTLFINNGIRNKVPKRNSNSIVTEFNFHEKSILQTESKK